MNDSELERSQRATVEREQEKLHATGTGTARSPGYIQEHEHVYEHEHAPRAFINEEDAPRRYSQIEDYGAIGNLRTAALISKQGSIDWFCFPHFDSPSIFGALLDAVKGGYFRIAPRNLDACRLQQMYMPDTNVLVSRFLSEEGVSQVTDFMPLSSRQEDIHPWLLREVVCVRGTTQIEVECFPAFEYGTATHSLSIVEPVGLEEYEAQLLRAQEQRQAAYPGELLAGAKPTGMTPPQHHQQGASKASITRSGDIASDTIPSSISAHDTSISSPPPHSEPVLLSDPKAARRMRLTQGRHVSPTARFVGPKCHFDLSLIVRTGQDVPAYDTRARVQVPVAEEPEGDNQPPSQGTANKDAQVSSAAVDESESLIEYQLIQRPSMRGFGVRGIVRLKESQTLYITTRFGCGAVRPMPAVTHDYFVDLLARTQQYWHEWTSKCRYRGRWRESVLRSALVLKLMTFAPTGGIVAALSTSLPEGLGLSRNWDYRFTWVRDAAFTVYAFLRIGFLEEAEAYMKWIELRCREMQQTGHLQIMYGVDGRHELTEDILSHWEGYKGSGPVRIGNHAYQQTQNDIYGELLNSVSLSDSSGAPISFDFWMHLRKLLNYVCAHWQDSDFGIWEVRGGQQHFIYSKIMCWVALDRGINLAQTRKFPSEALKWAEVRDQIYEEVMAKGYSYTLQAFKQSYDKDALDAANLMLPLVMFVSPNDPRMLSTIDAMLRSPEQGGLVANNLCFRYNVRTTDDGLTGEEGTFSICSFWLVEALARAGQFDRRRLEHARLIFEQMLSYGNHLGLFSEQIGKTGEQLGNFPQAFTHLALISAALYLDNLLG